MEFSFTAGGYAPGHSSVSLIRASYWEAASPLLEKARVCEAAGKIDWANGWYGKCVPIFVELWIALGEQDAIRRAEEYAEKAGIDIIGILEQRGEEYRRWYTSKKEDLVGMRCFGKAGHIAHKKGDLERAILDFYLSDQEKLSAERVANENGLGTFFEQVRTRHKTNYLSLWRKYGLENCIWNMRENNPPFRRILTGVLNLIAEGY